MRNTAILILRIRLLLPILSLVLCLATGCYSAGHSRIVGSLESTNQPTHSATNFGNIGLLLPPQEIPPFAYRYPRTTKEAFFHTAERTLKGTDLDDGLDEIIAGLVLSGTAGLIGSAITGVSPDKIKASEVTIQRALDEQSVLLGIFNRLHACVDERGLPPLMFIPQDVAEHLGPIPAEERDYSVLIPMGIDSVMEFDLHSHGFSAPEGGNPPMMMELTVHVRIARVMDGAILFERDIQYRGHRHRFTHWGADDAEKLRGELRRAGRVVGRSIVDQVFFPVSTTQISDAERN